MDNPENTEGAIKNGQSREYRKCNQEWTIQRILKVQSRMDNPENTEGAIKNGQSREYRRCNQEWAIQRILKVQSRMDNPENTEGAIKNGQSRETSNIGYTKTQDEHKQNKKHNTICVGHHYSYKIDQVHAHTSVEPYTKQTVHYFNSRKQ